MYKVYPCKEEEALIHTHLRPFIAKLLSGACDVEIGYGEGEENPPVVCKFRLTEGSSYSALDPYGWHKIYTVEKPAMMIVVTSPPWGRSCPDQDDERTVLLSREQQTEILGFFRSYYPHNKSRWNIDFRRYIAETLKMSFEEFQEATANLSNL